MSAFHQSVLQTLAKDSPHAEQVPGVLFKYRLLLNVAELDSCIFSADS
jgi:hypothetical protein